WFRRCSAWGRSWLFARWLGARFPPPQYWTIHIRVGRGRRWRRGGIRRGGGRIFRGRAVLPALQHWTLIVAGTRRARRLCGFIFAAGFGLQMSSSDPCAVLLQRPINGHQADWLATTLDFIHRAGVYRHGHRIDVVNAGIEIIAALEQRNRIELGGILLASAQLHHRQRARSTRFAGS